MFLVIIGFIMFAYGCWDAGVGFEFNPNWPDWMDSFTIGLAGLLIFTIGISLAF